MAADGECYYSMRADLARKAAAGTLDGALKSAYLKLAEDWEAMAAKAGPIPVVPFVRGAKANSDL